MAEQTQTVLAPVHGLTRDFDKKIVCKLLNNRWTIKVVTAEGAIYLTPREARLVAIAIRRQQRIDSNRLRLAKKREAREKLQLQLQPVGASDGT